MICSPALNLALSSQRRGRSRIISSRGALTRNTLAYLRLFAEMDFMFSNFYILVTYSYFFKDYLIDNDMNSFLCQKICQKNDYVNLA